MDSTVERNGQKKTFSKNNTKYEYNKGVTFEIDENLTHQEWKRQGKKIETAISKLGNSTCLLINKYRERKMVEARAGSHIPPAMGG